MGMKNILDFSTEKKVLLIVTFFILIAFALAGMLYLQGNIFNGVRAYVRGEGLWAKAQKDAVLYLERYSYTRVESDYRMFENAVLVNLGDRSARIALSSKPPQREKAIKGFLEGNNDPADVDGLIWFFLNFRHISYVHDAIVIWAEADEEIAKLITLGKAIQTEFGRQKPDEKQIVQLRLQLQQLNEKLLELENRFSTVLGEGARWVKQTIWLASVVILLLFVSIGIYLSRQIIVSITRGEQALLASESRFRSLRDSDTIGIISWRMNGLIDEANAFFLNMLGYTKSDLKAGMIDWKNMTPKEWQASDGQAVEELLEYGRCQPFEKEMMHKDGHLVPVFVGASLLEGDSGHGIAYVMDLSERKKAEEELKLASAVFSSSREGILIADASMNIVSVNRAFVQMTGYEESELIGKKPSILKSGHTTREQYRMIFTALEGEGAWSGDIIDRRKEGELLPLHVSISSVKNKGGVPTHYIAIMSDNSEHKAREEHLNHIAHHDPLTGLPNRVLFNDRVKQAIEEAKRKNSSFTVLFLDLDRFKPINDTFGHKVGDQVLQTVARELQQIVREIDTVTRIGGDEFVILLKEVGRRENVEKICRKISETVSAPIYIGGEKIQVGVSVGFSIYPDDGEDIKALLDCADNAMYAIKQKGKASKA